MSPQSSEFRTFWLAQATSRFGDPITLIALAIVTYGRTNSALFTALAVVIATLPTAVFGFFAGAVADALGHRRAMFISDIARVGLIGAIPPLLDLGAPLAVAYVLVFIAALFTAVFNPARIAIIPQLVPPSDLAAANASDCRDPRHAGSRPPGREHRRFSVLRRCGNICDLRDPVGHVAYPRW